MAPTWIETDVNTNKDINAAVSVGVYTSTGDKFVMPQLLADQVAGGGDYVYYVTLQVAGAGSHYVIGPKTTHTAAAGETAIGAQGGFIAVRNGDVLTVYIDGLAGDTATPDVTVRWFELDASANVKQWKSETPGDLVNGLVKTAVYQTGNTEAVNVFPSSADGNVITLGSTLTIDPEMLVGATIQFEYSEGFEP